MSKTVALRNIGLEPCERWAHTEYSLGYHPEYLIGSFVDCRDMTFGHWDKVRSDIERTFARLADCRGAIVAVGNHLPSNIPDEMLDRYFEELLHDPGRLERWAAIACEEAEMHAS